jgi:predicted  nucleic acid-binding Zn-ribbon protein
MERLWATVNKLKTEVSECKEQLQGLHHDFKGSVSDSRFQDLTSECNSLRVIADIANGKIVDLEKHCTQMKMDSDDMARRVGETINVNSEENQSRKAQMNETFRVFGSKIDKMDQVVYDLDKNVLKLKLQRR